MTLEMAHLSVEIAHVYLGELTEKTASDAVAAAIDRVSPVVDRMIKDHGRTVSTCILIDDYFESKGPTPEQAVGIFRNVAARAGFRLDWIAFEADCAVAADYFFDNLYPQPIFGESSHGELYGEPNRLSRSGQSWISNGDPTRETKAPRSRRFLGEEAKYLPGKVRPEIATSIALDVEIAKAEPQSDDSALLWSCPFLAACWQLIRLGCWREPSGGMLAPKRLLAVSDLPPPFFARRTLSHLPSRYLRVEHAVQVILAQLAIDDRARMEIDPHTKQFEIREYIEYAFGGY
jgi:hypothetical protein